MKIGFNFGTDPDTSEPHLELGAMTLIVGPNGAGKSLLLEELAEQKPFLFGNGSKYPENLLLGCFHPTGPRPFEDERWRDKVRDGIATQVNDFARYYMSAPPERDDEARRGADQLAWIYQNGYRGRNPETALDMQDIRELALTELSNFIQAAQGGDNGADSRTIASQLIKENLVSIGGISPLSITLSTLSSRFSALHSRKLRFASKNAADALMRLLQEEDVLRTVNEALAKLAGFKIAIDASDMTHLHVVSYEPAAGPVPNSAPWSNESKAFFSRARPLEEHCDGNRSLASLIVESLVLDTDLLLLDEPEISLHPPLARQLGAHLTNLAAERGISIIAATHSPEFVAGCLSTRRPVSICRLDYRDGRGSALPLSGDLVSEMSSDPLLRSTGILGSLFHKAALVCEGASDIALYGEISDRLSLREEDYPRVMRDTLMINANGRKSLPKIVTKLRASGVPCACITDLDLLNDNAVLRALLVAVDAHETTIQSLLGMSEQVSSIFNDRRHLLKQGGVESLQKKERESVKLFTGNLALHGIFVPENGSLEHWLPEFTQVNRGGRHKSDFIPSIFEAMGPTATGLAPANGGIWRFMRQVANWLAEPIETAS